jgi:hypothetical protein
MLIEKYRIVIARVYPKQSSYLSTKVGKFLDCFSLRLRNDDKRDLITVE